MIAIILPAFIVAKSCGRIINIRLGPALRFSGEPQAKTAGIIASPAKNAITVSNISICHTDVSILISFFI